MGGLDIGMRELGALIHGRVLNHFSQLSAHAQELMNWSV